MGASHLTFGAAAEVKAFTTSIRNPAVAPFFLLLRGDPLSACAGPSPAPVCAFLSPADRPCLTTSWTPLKLAEKKLCLPTRDPS